MSVNKNVLNASLKKAFSSFFHIKTKSTMVNKIIFVQRFCLKCSVSESCCITLVEMIKFTSV